MKWNTIENSAALPRDGRPFISLWKGRISLTQYDTEEGRFYIMFDLAEYSQSWCIPQDRENKFTHWMELPNMPEDY
jgi:hypothetical protein